MWVWLVKVRNVVSLCSLVWFWVYFGVGATERNECTRSRPRSGIACREGKANYHGKKERLSLMLKKLHSK